MSGEVVIFPTRARAEGRAAGAAGQSCEACPYPPHQRRQHEEWLRGYFEAAPPMKLEDWREAFGLVAAEMDRARLALLEIYETGPPEMQRIAAKGLPPSVLKRQG